MAEAACEPTVFDGLNGLESVAAAARGDVAREPALNQVTQELPASAKGKGGKSFRASVPVYFHVVHAGGVGNISNKVIADQMRVLNAAFAGFYGGAASGRRSTSPVSRGPTTRLGTRPVRAPSLEPRISQLKSRLVYFVPGVPESERRDVRKGEGHL